MGARYHLRRTAADAPAYSGVRGIIKLRYRSSDDVDFSRPGIGKGARLGVFAIFRLSPPVESAGPVSLAQLLHSTLNRPIFLRLVDTACAERIAICGKLALK